MQLIIINKNYSSWSMRPWVLMKQAGIEFTEEKLPLDAFEAGSRFKQQVGRYNPVGKVPVLVDGDLVVWDTLAICEYLAETFPDKALWPRDRAARARARSVCAEMHSGFVPLRSAFPMNIHARLPEVGARLLAEKAEVRADLARITSMWGELLAQHGGPMLFGDFSIADAYFAPVVMRLTTYAAPVPEAVAAYMDRVRALPGVAAWIDDARAEPFVPFEEPYRKQP